MKGVWVPWPLNPMSESDRSRLFWATLPLVRAIEVPYRFVRAGVMTRHPEGYLHSFPRSGNTWVRYIAECITGRGTSEIGNHWRESEWVARTGHLWRLEHHADCGTIDVRRPVLIKRHQLKE